MSKQPKDLREMLSMYKFDMDVLQKIPCTAKECKQYKKLLKEGQPLPDGVFRPLPFCEPSLTRASSAAMMALPH